MHYPLNNPVWGALPTKQSRETLLTVWGAVGEERNQQRHIVNVLQVGSDLVDTTGKLGLQRAKYKQKYLIKTCFSSL